MTITQLLENALFVIVVVYLMNQVRRPTRWVGRPILWAMNHSHAGVTDWGLRHVAIDTRSTILDIGCGGGRTIQKMAAIATEGKVYGIDYAAGSVAAASSANASLIDAGRVEIQRASVSQLPFADNTFDLVTAVETQYYWPDLPGAMREIQRVLKPGGTVTIIVESYRSARGATLSRVSMKLLRARLLSVDEQRQLFSAAGYATVETFEEPRKGWFCATATKPISPSAIPV